MDQKLGFAPFTFRADSPFAAAASAPLNPFLPTSEPEETAVAVSDAVWAQDTGETSDEDSVLTGDAVDVRVLWGTNVLCFEQLSPPRAFTVGDGATDFTLPESMLASGCSLVAMRGERPVVRVPASATVLVKLMNGTLAMLPECLAQGIAERSSDEAGAHEILLPHGATATVRFPESELVFEVTRSRARQQVATGILAGADLSGHLFTGLSALAHAAIIGSLAFFLPSMQNDDAEAVDRNSAAAMAPYLAAIAEREPEQKEVVNEGGQTAPGGGQGSQAAAPSGVMGRTVATSTAGHFAIKGEEKDTKLAREQALREAATFGTIGLLNTDSTATDTPVASWGELTAAGHESRNALGNLWAPSIDDALGLNGLGLSGAGEGGGGLYHGVGINGVGATIGGGSGTCPPGQQCFGPGHGLGPGGMGNGHGPSGGGHIPTAPTLRNPTVDVNGSIPPEVVQRIVRQNFGRFRLCYEGGLRQNPGLAGRVSVAFMIDKNGTVATALSDHNTDMPDAQVVSCVVRGFANLQFPEPKNGMVKVIYPLVLSPGE
jgi:hypothetical protein